MLAEREKVTADTLYDVRGEAVRQEDAIAAGELVCEWFALCERTATTAVPHPILGLVPTCARHAAFD
jgi:hypothetical protein